MDMQRVFHYRRRAEELKRLGDFGIDDECMEWAQSVGDLSPSTGSRLCANAAALLYVHAGIAISDAMLVFLTGDRGTAQDHKQAISKLAKECARKNRPNDGVKHFRWLVQKKDYFAYDERYVTLEDANQAKLRIDNLLSWAYKIFPEIAENDGD